MGLPGDTQQFRGGDEGHPSQPRPQRHPSLMAPPPGSPPGVPNLQSLCAVPLPTSCSILPRLLLEVAVCEVVARS